MIINQPDDLKIRMPNGTLNIKWNKNFGKLTSENILRTQKFIDSECIRHMIPYTPMRNGKLYQSAIKSTVIGSGTIIQDERYAHYQYRGLVYGPNFPIWENGIIVAWRSRKNMKKHPTGGQLQHSTAKHPKAGPFWFERMKKDKKDVILMGAAKISGGKAE